MGLRRQDESAPLDAIESIYRRDLPRFRRMATAIAGSADLGRDAVQEAFASAVRTRHSFRGEGPLEAWLWKAVVNAANNQRRSYERAQASPPLPERTDEVEATAANDIVRDAMSLMPERQRVALFLRYYADLDYRQIAAVLGIAPGTVGATLSAARANLERLLEEVPS